MYFYAVSFLFLWSPKIIVLAQECLEISEFCEVTEDLYCQLKFSDLARHSFRKMKDESGVMSALEIYADALYLVR